MSYGCKFRICSVRSFDHHHAMAKLIRVTMRSIRSPISGTWALLCALLCVAAFVRPFNALPQATTAPAEARAEADLELATKLLPSDPDSALLVALQLEQQLGQLTGGEQQARALMVLGDAYAATAEMPQALAAYQRAQVQLDGALTKTPEAVPLLLARADLELKLGSLYMDLRDLPKSIAHSNAALRTLDIEHGTLPTEEVNVRKVRAFNNLAGVYLLRSEHALALPYFEQALAMNQPLNNRRNEGALTNNIGICYMEMGEPMKAEEYLLRSLAARKQLGDVRGQAQVLNNLGKNQALIGHFAAARAHFEQALSLGRAISSPRSMVISLESLAQLYDTLGEYRSALGAFREFKTLNDSLYSAESRTTIARLEDSFRRDKEKKVFELEAQRKDAESARRQTWNIALGIALFFLALTAFLLYKVMQGRVRHSALEQETLRLHGEKLAAEQAALKEDLEYRERELTANALFLLKKNELIAHIVERLLKARPTFRQENQRIVQEIIRDLQASQDEHNWKEFEAHFTRVHSTFYQTLLERFPTLTPNERKLCAFLRLNMSTKDISAITQQSLNSIIVARSRLRKKLQIEGEDMQLVDFLLSI